MALGNQPSLHFGVTRMRQVVDGAVLPVAAAGAAILAGGPWWVSVIAGPMSILLALRAFEASLD